MDPPEPERIHYSTDLPAVPRHPPPSWPLSAANHPEDVRRVPGLFDKIAENSWVIEGYPET